MTLNKAQEIVKNPQRYTQEQLAQAQYIIQQYAKELYL